MLRQTDLTVIEQEYKVLIGENSDDSGNLNWSAIASALVRDGDWTDRGATHLIQLVNDYGAFILRNAAALAIAAEVADGDLRL